ncbi:three component ABC system middle component [Colwellia sp. E2M01]|uniref:4'-phosphopantetheinyl transferase family protein n=1 Tax=Colwellia sp. E2M01 TaxID=2841561 RepID=UPI001C08B6CB|nr:three component ABC system middle component [Colwellia sp. E2M01]MBU2871611.1 4'-phosphopantetheinyl transferase superfamily protein [Colwellia sp. E2M01]
MTTIIISADINSPWFVEQQAYWLDQLNDKETFRYSAIKSPRKKQQMLLSRALIAKALTKFNCRLNGNYDIINYAHLVLPLYNQTFSISITHSGTMAAIILSDKQIKLGIDIEQIKKRNFTELAAEFCTDSELLSVNQNNNIEADFYQLWTAKESLAKASHYPLHTLYQCDCSIVLTNDTGVIHWQKNTFYFKLFILPGYKGTVVLNSQENIEIIPSN